MDRPHLSGHGELSWLLKSGEIQSCHSSCFLRNTSCWHQGKRCFSVYLIFCPSCPRVTSSSNRIFKNESVRMEERCHCSPNPPASGAGWGWAPSIVPAHNTAPSSNLSLCHEGQPLLTVLSNWHTPASGMLSAPVARSMQY